MLSEIGPPLTKVPRFLVGYAQGLSTILPVLGLGPGPCSGPFLSGSNIGISSRCMHAVLCNQDHEHSNAIQAVCIQYLISLL